MGRPHPLPDTPPGHDRRGRNPARNRPDRACFTTALETDRDQVITAHAIIPAAEGTDSSSRSRQQFMERMSMSDLLPTGPAVVDGLNLDPSAGS